MTGSTIRALDALADLYRYPRGDLAPRVRHALSVLETVSVEARSALQQLADYVDTHTPWECEELHVRTFDLNPVCALEVGWQVYGEKYARGTFLVRMRELARAANVDLGTELADHLTNVLAVAGRVNLARGAKLAGSFALPAIEQMRKSFTGSDNPYAGLLDATAHTLRSVFDVTPFAAAAATTARAIAAARAEADRTSGGGGDL